MKQCFYCFSHFASFWDIWSKIKVLHWIKQTMSRLIMSNQRGAKLAKLHLCRHRIRKFLSNKRGKEDYHWCHTVSGEWEIRGGKFYGNKPWSKMITCTTRINFSWKWWNWRIPWISLSDTGFIYLFKMFYHFAMIHLHHVFMITTQSLGFIL